MATKDKNFNAVIDYKNRCIYWGDLESGDGGSEFTWDSVEATIRAIRHLASINRKPIELHMSSVGGDVIEMLRLYDVIQSCPCQIKFFGGGHIMSAAVWIMAGCDERYLYPHTELMLHKWSGEVTGTDIEHRIEYHVGLRLTNTLNTIFEKNSKMSADFWNEITHRDLYISAEEAIMLGIADKIIEPKKRDNLRRARIALMNRPTDGTQMRQLVKQLSKRVHLSRSLRIDIQIPHEQCDADIVIETTEPSPTPCEIEAPSKDVPEE